MNSEQLTTAPHFKVIFLKPSQPWRTSIFGTGDERNMDINSAQPGWNPYEGLMPRGPGDCRHGYVVSWISFTSRVVLTLENPIWMILAGPC